jgi:hypothetical protein
VRNLLERVLSKQTDRVADKGTVSMEGLLTLTEQARILQKKSQLS